MILSSQRPFLNKDGLGLKKDRNPRKGIDHEKKIVQCINAHSVKRVGHLEPFFYKLKRSKGNNLRSYRTNALGSKKMWASKMKP